MKETQGGDVVALPSRRWQLARGLVVEVRAVDDQHSIAVVCELGHRGWVDVWAMGGVVCHQSRFATQIEAPSYPTAEIAALVDEWVAELLAAAGRRYDEYVRPPIASRRSPT